MQANTYNECSSFFYSWCHNLDYNLAAPTERTVFFSTVVNLWNVYELAPEAVFLPEGKQFFLLSSISCDADTRR